ncbi:MAG: N-6 DNA methylase [Candidatus Obscuribacterales bacterium]|nr:N-6 DNA methylase [Candidatus Obscuribacterales bacterium]
MVRTKEYPFANPISKELEEEIFDISQKELSSRLAPDVELLGTLFEQIANQSLDISLENEAKVGFDIQAKDRRRIVGQFYTPPHVVKYCFDIAFGRNSADLINRLRRAKSGTDMPDQQFRIESEGDPAFKILDPSCGTGNFLSGFLQFLDSQLSESVEPEEIYALACNSLFGRELDPRAAALARLAVTISTAGQVKKICGQDLEGRSTCVHLYKHLGQKLKKHIVVCDSILDAAELPTGDENVFDLVITNPPYVSFGARNQKVLLDTTARFLKRRYAEAAEYKVRYHSIFQDIAIRYTATGGSIVLLVPDGFLTGSYYRKLRRLLLSNCRIQSLSELPARVIPEAVVGRWCVAHYIKEKSAANYCVNLSTYIDDHGQAITSSIDLSGGRNYSLPIGELHDKSNDAFRLLFDKYDHKLMQITDQLPRLKSVVTGYTGIRSLAGKNSITARRPLNKTWRRGITSGAQVRRFVVAWDGDWININPELLFKGGFNERIIENPKILVRQTGDSLVCAYDKSGLYHLNNVHSFSPALSKDPTQDLLSLCALINSTLWRHLYRLRTRETGRALAQVDIDTVESMPLHLISRESSQLIAYLATIIAELISFGSMASPECSQKSDDLILFIDRSIDRLIYDAYELEPEIIQRVESVSAKPKSAKTAQAVLQSGGSEKFTGDSAVERLVEASVKLNSVNLTTAQDRLPSAKEVREFVEEISC